MASQVNMAPRRRRSNNRMKKSTVVVYGAAAAAACCCCCWTGVGGYTTTSLRRSDLAGVWRLTSQRSFLPQGVRDSSPPKVFPMKEFTVYPKKPPEPKKTLKEEEEEELLLMLSDDGCFVQYGRVSDLSSASSSSSTLSSSSSSSSSSSTNSNTTAMFGMVSLTKGVWDYRDGKLILAADRPKDADPMRVHDTILVGEVVASTEETVDGEGALPLQEEEEEEKPETKKTSSLPTLTKTTLALTEDEEQQQHLSTMDVHLSVPKGSVEIGKFFYPKSHPSFFDQPIFQPMPTGSFQLRQVLGTLNAKTHKEHDGMPPPERFRKKDLVGKRFFLTSFPLRYGNKNTKKGKERWSIKYQKMVEETKSPKQVEKERKEEENKPLPMAVMKIQLFQNNTFSSVAGLGSSTILRGKWSIIGHDRDQFWMRVWRFGFGRSVSGSVYSEGKSLTQDDEKGYWGQIVEVPKKQGHDDGDGDDKKQDKDQVDYPSTKKNSDEKDKKPKTVEINGSVILGWGLEPLPVARFTMREAMDDDDEEEEYGDDEDFDPEEDALEKTFRQEEVGGTGLGGGNIDMSSSWSDDAFQ